MSGNATYTRLMAAYEFPDHLLLDPVQRRRPRYRWRTWIRGHVPWAMVDWFPKGLEDCGQHRWHAWDEDTDRCYHCEVGVRPRQLFPPEQMRERERRGLVAQ
jgi:hypothetical protein